MATATTTPKSLIKGGSFLIENRLPEEIFTPEDLTDQHRLIRQTAREFAEQEILPRVHEIEAKKPGLLRELLKKAAEVGLCATDVPQKYGGLELDKISAISSETMMEEILSSSSPPYFCGTSVAHRPTSAAFFRSSRKRPGFFASISWTRGSISCSANSRAVWRIRRW